METSANADHLESRGQGAASRVADLIAANGQDRLGELPRREETGLTAAPPPSADAFALFGTTAETREGAIEVAKEFLRQGEPQTSPTGELPCVKILGELQQLVPRIERLSTIVVRVNEMMLSLFGTDGFLHRYRNDSPHLKKLLVKQLASMFFKKPQYCCFIQASTTAVYLGNELLQKGTIQPGSLLYTNSSIMPLMVLREGVDYKVYAFCGPNYDPVCGGWLFQEDDGTTTAELRRLFHRDRDPLTAAFVMPRWMDRQGNLYFEHKDTAHLVRVLAEEASRVVITLVADRLVEGVANSEGLAYPVPLAQFVVDKKDDKVCLLIAGEPKQSDIQEWGQSFSTIGFDVHWYDPSRNDWLRYEPKSPGIPR